MRTNWIKYIFISIVILLIGLAIYFLYRDKEGETNIYNVKTEIVTETQINIGITEYDTMNPILSKSRDIQYLSKLIYDSLIKITPEFKIENSIAEECSKINETTYLIKLKQNIYWHNGNVLTGKDVKFTIDGIKNFKGDSIYKKNVHNISNVEYIDDYMIKIYLDKEVPFFEYMLSFPILSQQGYDKDTLESTTKIPIGTGNYQIFDIKEKEVILEKKNSEVKSKLSRISIKIYNSPMDLYNNLTREKIDLINTTNIEYDEYIGTIGFNSYISQDREFDYLAINTNNKILSNKEIRQVLNYSIDKKSIVYNVYKNKYITSNFPLDYGSYLYDSVNTENESHIDKAKKILTDNGWSYESKRWKKTGVSSNLEFNIIVNENHINRILVAENIQDQLQQIGIKINIQKVSDNSFEEYLTNKNYELILTGNICPVYPELNSYLGQDNLSNYYNEEILGLLEEINNIQDVNLLKETYNRIIEIYNKEVPFISLYFNSNILISNKKVKGDIEHNWYNILYNIDGWYKVK